MPRLHMDSKASRKLAGLPVHSIAYIGPWPVTVAARMAGTNAVAFIALTDFVAPRDSANASLESCMSTTIISCTPVATAAKRAPIPTAPTPTMRREESCRGFSLFKMAPAPVWRPHPRGARAARSVEGSTLTQDDSATRASLEKEDCPKNPAQTGTPSPFNLQPAVACS